MARNTLGCNAGSPAWHRLRQRSVNQAKAGPPLPAKTTQDLSSFRRSASRLTASNPNLSIKPRPQPVLPGNWNRCLAQGINPRRSNLAALPPRLVNHGVACALTARIDRATRSAVPRGISPTTVTITSPSTVDMRLDTATVGPN